MKNWAGNFEYAAASFCEPETIEQVQEIVRSASQVKALGSRHSFSRIADTNGIHIGTRKLARIVDVNRTQSTVTIQGGVTYSELATALRKNGLALPNVASLPHISVIGACATATHGSGDGNQCLTSSVSSMDLVLANGELLTIARHSADFDGAAVHLGCLGVVVGITLDVVPSYQLSQYVYEGLPFSALERDLDAITSSAYSVSLFTDWRSKVFNQVWLKSLGELDRSEFFGARPATEKLHPVPGMPVENCTDQLGLQGHWDERLFHFRPEFTPSSGNELQSEFIVGRDQALDALAAVRELAPRIAPLLHISEIRTVAADQFWLSPFFERDSLCIHFTWKAMPERVASLLVDLEAALTPFGARAHWGKLFGNPGHYPRAAEFVALRSRLDPTGKFLGTCESLLA